MTADDTLAVAPPRATADLFGHAAAEQKLLAALRSARLAHAWLLAGPRGIGKATLAFRFARFMLAGGGQGGADLFGEAPRDLGLEPDHEVFRRVAAGAHPDLRVLALGVDERTGRPRGEIPVKDVREVGAFLRMTPAEGGWRIVVVDSIDQLNRNAANALLKFLEEPPERALLLLVSHAPGALLPTIRSRCCKLSLAPLSTAVMAKLLERHAPDLGTDDRAALARLGEGSIGRALDLAAGGGLDLYREMIELLGGLPRLDVPRVHALADRLAQGGDGTAFRTGMELLLWWLARLIRGAASDEPSANAGAVPGLVPGEDALMARVRAGHDLAHWLPLWEKISRLFAQADTANLDRKQVVVTAFLSLEAATS